MFMRSLFAKTLYDARKSMLGWVLGLIATAALTLAMYPVVRTGPYQQMLESSPEALRSAFGLGPGTDVTVGSGYLSAYLFGMMVPLLLTVFAISHGAKLVAGEEDRGTLDLLAALPVSRMRVLLVKAAALLASLGVLGATLLVAVVAAAPLVDLRVDLADLAAGVLSHTLLAALYGALALGVGAATGRHGFAVGVSTAVAVAGYMLPTLGPLTDASDWLQWVSPAYWAAGNDPMQNGVGAGLIALLTAIGLVVAAGTMAFSGRDLHV